MFPKRKRTKRILKSMFQVQNHSHNSVDDDDSPLGGINYIAVGDKSKKSAYVPKIARKKK